MNIKHITLTLLAALTFIATACTAAPTVNPGQSIQDAVNAAKPGDTITVAPGNYRSPIHADQKAGQRGPHQ